MAEEQKQEKSALEELEELHEQTEEMFARITVEAAKCGPEGYTLKLEDPIVVEGKSFAELHFRLPTAKDIIDNSTNGGIMAALCGVKLDVLAAQMDAIDFECGQRVVQGFRLRRAASRSARKGNAK